MAFCRILDDADCDLHFYRSSSGKPAHMDTPNGQTVILPRFGARFYMPYEDRHPHHATAEFVAAEIDGDELSIDYSPSEPGSNAAEAALPDSIDVDVEPALPQPAALPVPDAPTDEQRAHHNLTHADFAPWCPHCVAGKAPDAQHRRQNKHEDPEVPVLQVDYQFFSRDGQLVEEESRTATVLTGTDLSSGWPMMAFVPQKGADAYVVRAVVSWVKRLGYAKVVIQHDQEHALRTVVEQVQKELGHDRVQIRAAPRYSHASQGGAENANRLMAGMLRTWLSALNQAYPNPAEPLDINHPVVPWLCRWVAFVWARYHVQSDKLTPYRIVSGRDYATPIVQFGEVLLCKVPNTHSLNKSKPRWFKGLFVGRLELDDSAVILTNAGAITVRSIRRVPAADQYEVSYLNDACGLPWAPSGKRSKVRTQSSNVVAVPIPASDPPAPAPKASGDVQSAQPDVSCPGQICIRPPVMPDAPTSSDSHESRALGPGSGQNSVPGTPLSEARGMTPDSSHRMTMTPPTPPSPFAREIEGPASPFRGSGSMQIERDAPTPTGVNAIPLPSPVHSTDKRPLPQPSEPAAAATESQPKVPKVGTISSALQQIQDWARSGQWEQKICSVLDLLDTQLDPREVEKARDVQMATLVEKHFAVPKLKSEIPRKSKLFNFKWVDEIKRGVYRSRFTCADIKKKYSKEELAEETNTFAPTPYEESHVLLELKCLAKGWHTRSGDVRCAYLLGADSGDSSGNPVHVRMPPEYVKYFRSWLSEQSAETKSKFENITDVDLCKQVVLELVGNLYGRRPAGSNYRQEFEKVVTERLVPKGYRFVRGRRDPTVYTCAATDATLLHHVDDFRIGASDPDLEFFAV